MAENLLAAEMINISGSSPDLSRESSYKAILHTKQHDLILDMLVSVYERNDYVNERTTYIEIDAQLPLGDFLHYVYPERETLEITLIHYVVGSKTKKEYKLLLKTTEEGISSKQYNNIPMSELNKSYTNFRAQCLSKSYEHMRVKTTEGVFKDTDVKSVMSSIMLDKLGLISDSIGLGFGGVKLVPPDNSRTYKHIIIPNDTLVLDVPALLQKDPTYGVHNGGINTFFKAGTSELLHIFPLFKDNLFSHSDELLIIYGMAAPTLTGVESTYVKDGDDVKIVVPKTNKLNDDDIKNRDKGTKISEITSESVISRPYQISFDKIEFNSKWLKMMLNHKELPSGPTPVKANKPTGNHYNSRSEVMKQDGIMVKLEWKYSKADLLVPMMPIQYIEETDGKVQTYTGILHKVDTITDNNNRVETSTLFVFIKPSSGFMSGNSTFDKIKDVASGLGLF